MRIPAISPSNEAKTMLTCAELAARWDVDVKTIYESINLRQLPVVRLGRKVLRIALSVVERIEQEGRVEPGGQSHAGSS